MATLDGTRIDALRTARGWSWATLAQHAGVSLRRVLDVHNGTAGEVRDDTVFRLAAALQVEPESLFRKPYSSIRWMIPSALHDQREILPTVEVMQHLDMEGEADQAEQLCRSLLQTVPRPNLEVHTHLTVLRAVYLEHLDRNGEALALLLVAEEELRAAPRRDRCSEAALLWVQYQKGVCLIAAGALDEARVIFEDLRDRRLFPALDLESQPHRSSVFHQLGVIAHRTERPQEARDYFRRALGSREVQHCLVGHRPGFTLRRLGEVAEGLGEYDEALDRYLDALEIFARYHCTRYLATTRDAVRRVARLLDGPKRNSG